MSQGNGVPVCRIGRKGRKTYAIGEEGEPFTIDVIDVHNQWIDVDRSMRGEDGKVPFDKVGELNRLAHQFVTEVSGTPDLTMTEALEFLKELTLESERLARFFVMPSGGGPSSPGPTELIFSE